ncbi:MAG TPA: RNA polymerase subunit sigma-24 [Planctomycetaceae bacterium]|nr:RNA polymerase subunit sigma-24 [Gimesia sp.]HBL47086.1 RNA polymerase subunit sigma-24 [Planctomycetaceae bacterium]|tara:strand:+ start:339 stop:1340 length:1002 start_codon:yes stop_codon:yes gene_type:complete
MGLMSCLCSILPAADETILAIEGRRMTAEQAAVVEKQVKENPKDSEARVKLLGYYFTKQFADAAARKAKQENVLWLIENEPQSKIMGSPFGQMDAILDGEAYTRGKQAWEKQLKAQPDNLKLLDHAANYLMLHDRDLAKQLLEKAQKLDAENPQWARDLGQLYSLDMQSSSSLKAQKDAAAKALQQLEIAYQLSANHAKDALLTSLAKAALGAGDTEKARQYAELMLNQVGSDWNSGNKVHYANITLGKIALAEGNMEAAKQYLIKAGKTKGSPQLNSFGPDFSLAKALLEKDQKEVVLEYLTLCGNFWALGKARLAEWSKAIKDNQIPKTLR